ncbi:hypothetical protein DTO166G4_4407 [Paecilomyces variotii]|nr:hypothetical protein DTO166G4_4407 [Paecilomyces variotii]KAJ9231433.1 hypothetical protein DTO166G5_6765 [Paecilomyces variotii]KAJ9303982.1 hypothetical protein DTO217A2_6515 [Paecilomyces variotii]
MNTESTQDDHISEIFQEAFSLFVGSLSEDERKDLQIYQSAEAMTIAIRNQVEEESNYYRKRKLGKCMNTFQEFGQNVKQYFAVVDIFVQTNPQYAGLIWGALRLLFQISSNYIEYLEKLSSMFQSLCLMLEVYEEHYEVFRENVMKRNETVTIRLRKALANIYVDIIQLCYRTLRLFTSKKHARLRFTRSFIGRLMWKPFDLEFQGLKHRFDQSRELFEYEATRSTREVALRFIKEYDEWMEKTERPETDPEGAIGDEKKDEIEWLDTRVQELGQWIDAPQWKDIYEEASMFRQPGTCDWILEDPLYKNWRLYKHSDKPILSIQGKPGFGKTTICPVVIDNLVKPQESSQPLPHNVVAYYFFNGRIGQDTAGLAFRSILAQLLQIFRHETRAVDIASALCDWKVVGQRRATDNEVFAVLRLLFKRFPGSNIVIDAVDECSDPNNLLDRIYDLTHGFEGTSLVIFSRPTVEIPESWEGKFDILNLLREHNAGDLTLFVKSKVEELMERKLLPTASSDVHVEKIVPRANGMFLWVKLLIKFLQLKRLTVNQRLDAIENLNRLEGLDAIYTEISRKLSDDAATEWNINIIKGFRWILGVRRPIHIKELLEAIIVPFDRPRTVGDIIPDFEKSFGSIFGGLLELTTSRMVQFIHMSAYEFFTTTERAGISNRSATNLQSDKVQIHLTIGLTALAYLVHTVPAEPLSGDRNVIPNATLTRGKFPLLPYVAQYWSQHIVEAIMHSTPALDIYRDGHDHLIRLLLEFVYSKPRVTMWLEASWLFRNPPVVCPLPDNMFDATGNYDSQLSEVVKETSRFSEDVKTLNNSWSYILEKEPNEVWGDSIQSFTKSKYLQTTDSRVVFVAHPEDTDARSILLQTQVSGDSMRIATVRLIPPGSVLEGPRQRAGPQDIVDWQIRYDLWTLDGEKRLCSLLWEVDPAALDILFKGATNRHPMISQSTRFRFPISISNDLWRVAALNLVINIEISEQIGPDFDRPRIQCEKLDIFNRTPPHKQTILDDSVQLKIWDQEPVAVVFRRASGIFPSDSGDLAHEGLIQFYRGRTHGSSDQGYACFASWRFYLPSAYSMHFLDKAVVFHPTSPVVAFCAFGPLGQHVPRKPQTYVWDFSSNIYNDRDFLAHPPVVGLRIVYDGTLDLMTFTPDGDYVCGKDFHTGRPVIVKVGDCATPGKINFHNQEQRQGDGPGPMQGPNTDTPGAQTDLQIQTEQKTTENLLQYLSNREVSRESQIRVGSLAFTRSGDGVGHISQLSNLEHEAAVVLETLGTDGRLQSQTLTRLPNQLRSISMPTLLNTPGGEQSEYVRILLNKAVQDRYSLNDIAERPGMLLPVMLERSRESIPTYTATNQQAILGAGDRDLFVKRTNNRSS